MGQTIITTQDRKIHTCEKSLDFFWFECVLNYSESTWKTQAWRLCTWLKLETFGNEDIAKILQAAKKELEKLKHKKIPKLFQAFEETAF